MVNGDLSIFSSDPALTSLQNLSLGKLQDGLKQSVPEHLLDAPVSSYRISNLRYSPQQKMVVGMTSAKSNRPISLRIFPRDKLQNRLAKATRTQPGHAFLLEELHAIAWVFPGERKLQLDVLDKPGQLAQLLRKYRGYELYDLELLHFVPEHTYTACATGIRDTGARVREYLKVHYDNSGLETARIMQRLAQSQGNVRIRIPDDVTYIAEHRLLIQSELVRDTQCPLTLETAASALSQFHSLHVPDVADAPLSVESDHKAVMRVVQAVFPALQPRIADLSKAILRELHLAGDGPRVLLHGDAHLGNVFHIEGGDVGFIDLDRVCCGPAVSDLASFVAFKAWLRIRDRKSTSRIIGQLPQFIAAYNQHSQKPVDICQLLAHLANKMVTERIRRGITRGKIAGPGEIDVFVDFAQQCLREAGVQREQQ